MSDRFPIMSFLLLVTSILLSSPGCQHLPTLQEEKPVWISHPDAAQQSSQFITAMGVGDTAPTHEMKLHEAEDAARKELARRFTQYCNSAIEDFLKSQPGLASPDSVAAEDFATTISSATASGLLRRIIRHDTWYNSTEDAVYVLYRLPVRRVNEAIVRETRTALQGGVVDTPVDENKAIEELQHFLDSRLKDRLAEAAKKEESPPPEVSENQPPDWLARGRDKRHPIDEFIVATGLGPDREAAEKSAQRDLLMRLTGAMESAVEHLPRDEQAVLLEDAGAVKFSPADLGPEQFPAIDMRRYWFDTVTGTYYTLGVLERDAVARRYGERAKKDARTSRELFETARNNHRADNFRTALRQYLLSLRALRRSVVARLIVHAVHVESDRQMSRSEAPGADEIKGNLQKFLDEFTLQRISGDKQWVPPGQSPAEALKVKVVAGRQNTPVEDIPLTFRFPQRNGKFQKNTATNADGMATYEAPGLDNGSQRYSDIVCTLALEKLALDADVSGLDLPTVTFRLVFRTMDNTQLALSIHASQLIPPECAVTDELTENLATAGYTVLPEKELPPDIRQGQLGPDPSEDEIHTAFDSLSDSMAEKAFLLVLYGTASAQVVEERETSQGTLYFVHVPIRVRVVDPGLPSDRTLFQVSVTGKGAYAGDKNEAIRRACERAVGQISQRLAERLREKFEF